MERRKILQFLAMGTGASIGVPASVYARLAEPVDPATLDFFSAAQRAECAALAEAILPRTDTPGAIDAGVPAWIEVIARDCLPEDEQAELRDGLDAIAAACREARDKPLAELDPEAQVAFLTAEHQRQREAGSSFLADFKDLATFCFVHSEVGASEVFDWTLVPAAWDPARPVTPETKVPVMS